LAEERLIEEAVQLLKVEDYYIIFQDDPYFSHVTRRTLPTIDGGQ
jgi:hypothetical protein